MLDTPGNDGARSDSGPPEELSGLPPEWGPIVIPDDASALASEAALVRRELRQRASRDGRRRQPGWPADDARLPVHLPLLALLIAVLVTLASLLAVIWPGQGRPTGSRAAAPGGATPTGPTGVDPSGQPVPALDLVDENRRPVALRALLPAVIVLVDGCACVEQARQAVRLVPPGVNVLAVAESGRSDGPYRPRLTATGTSPRTLTDPTGGLRTFLHLDTPAGHPVTVLVARSGRVVRVLPDPSTLTGHQNELAGLPTG